MEEFGVFCYNKILELHVKQYSVNLKWTWTGYKCML